MIKVALAGQPNCGKSTIFNMLSGVNQHVANYPGVTVDKKSTRIRHKEKRIEIVDLPGTYAFSTFSLEERVAKDFLMDEQPDVIINVLDASCLTRSLSLTIQLIELGKPIIVALNMMDIARQRGLKIDIEALSKELGVPIIETVASRQIGKAALLDAIISQYQHPTRSPLRINYAPLDVVIDQLSQLAHEKSGLSGRWLAIKALEQDQSSINKMALPDGALGKIETEIKQHYPDIDIVSHFVSARHRVASQLYSLCVKNTRKNRETMTHKIDAFVLNRWVAFPFLGLVIFMVYELAIVGGYQLTNYTWPYFAMCKNFLINLMPEPSFTQVPLFTEFGVWMINSVLALLNYIPIFFILFALIAIMEDVGYMPRIAFMLDRLFRRFGLHGQSTLPLVLGGAFVGGCAVPGIMASKGIADERARLATVMTVPYMNCMAKVPFYTLLLGAFFANQMSIVMFFISTVTIFIALCFARVFSLTLLKHAESAPFIMELPPYHLPVWTSILRTAFQRIWIYISKVSTIVVAVAVVLFALLQFPGLSENKEMDVQHQSEQALTKFSQTVNKTPYAEQFSDTETETIYTMLNLYNRYRADKMTASSPEQAKKLDEQFTQQTPELFIFLSPKDAHSRTVNRAVRDLAREGQRIQREVKDNKIENSFLGIFGRALEPVTQWAGFDWRVNVAFLSSFAARESAVATLGSLYESGKTERAEEAFASQEGYTPLHAIAMIIFMVFTPPCIAAMIVLKMNVHSYKLMLSAMFIPFFIGIVVSSVFFQIGVHFKLSGVMMMGIFYFSMVILTLLLGQIGQKKTVSVDPNLRIYARSKE